MFKTLGCHFLLGCSLLVTGCSGASGPGRGPGAGYSAATWAPTGPVALTTDEKVDLTFMREEEKLARDVYQTLASFWRGQAGAESLVLILDNIAPSEQRHTDRLKAFLAAAGLPDPVSADGPVGQFTDPTLAALYTDLVAQGQASVTAALKVGALIEEKDLADLDAALARCQDAQLKATYESLACGSENHLRSFTGPLRAAGASYTAQVLPQARVDAILAAAAGPCGGR